jgi:hypothetical protein
MVAKIKNIIGLKSGRLTVVKELPSKLQPSKIAKSGFVPQRMVGCICECSNVVNCSLNNIRRKTRVSCGCIRKEGLNKKHGYCGTKTYGAWTRMKGRCNNPNHDSYIYYGNKGIKVCDKWNNSFEEFLKDMGDCPEGYSIGRIDVNKGYEPNNCKWVKNRTKGL